MLLLAGCGTQFIYNRLDWLLHYYLAGQVSLDGAQSRELRANLRTFMSWHRHSELPRYAAFLERVAAGTKQPVEFAQLDAGRIEIDGFVRDAVTHGAPDAARWLDGLRPAQVNELFASFADDERKAREKHCAEDPAARRADGAERFIDNVEDWTGRLRRSQRELVETRLAAIEGDSCTDVSAQERSRIEFRELVGKYRQQPGFADRIATFMTQAEDRWDPEYRRTYRANRTRYLELMVDLGHTLSETQRARAIGRLRSFARDLRELAAE
jgi:uncharacterized protein DUF6279